MTVVYIIIAIIMLGALIFLHELGHYLVGRLMNIGIKEFAVGMGPKLISAKRTHKIKANGETRDETTVYSLRALPLGGFCAFVGEDEDDSDPTAMNNAPAWKRLLTVAAGPLMNLLIAFVIGTVLISASLIPNMYEKTEPRLVISSVIEGTPAAEAGVQGGDVVLSVNGESMIGRDVDAFRSMISSLNEGEKAVIEVKRGDDTATLYVGSRLNEQGERMLGVYIGESAEYAEYDCNVLEAMGESVALMKNTAIETYKTLVSLISKLFNGQKIPEGSVSGVVGIVSNVSGDLSYGFGRNFGMGVFVIFYYMMFISLSLGIMNLLPLPALDGGRLVALIFELITGKHLNRKAEGYINLAGLVLLLALMVFVTFSDIKMLFK